MAYAFGLPANVTQIIYSMRDPKNWNGDKYKRGALDQLFGTRDDKQLQIDRNPPCPYYKRGIGGNIFLISKRRSWFDDEDNLMVYEWGKGEYTMAARIVFNQHFADVYDRFESRGLRI